MFANKVIDFVVNEVRSVDIPCLNCLVHIGGIIGVFRKYSKATVIITRLTTKRHLGFCNIRLSYLKNGADDHDTDQINTPFVTLGSFQI